MYEEEDGNEDEIEVKYVVFLETLHRTVQLRPISKEEWEYLSAAFEADELDVTRAFLNESNQGVNFSNVISIRAVEYFGDD